jgi:hypothetical protein
LTVRERRRFAGCGLQQVTFLDANKKAMPPQVVLARRLQLGHMTL